MPWTLSSQSLIDRGQEGHESLQRTSPLIVPTFYLHKQVRLTPTPSTEHTFEQYVNSAGAHIKQISQR